MAGIERIENGLLPRIVIRGEHPARMKLSERMAHAGVPGVSVAVFRNGRVEWSRGYGVRAASGNDPVTPDTVYQAGSISKPVTAMAALRLVEQGLLDLDEDVNLQLTSWQVPENEFTAVEKVTLRRLLSHSAGVTNHAVGSYSGGAPLPTLLEALDGTPPATSAPIRVDVAPGSRWRYSGGGYTVLQQLLIDVTGLAFPDLIDHLVFTPLRMARSTFLLPLPERLAEAAASGHDYAGVLVEGGWRVFPELAAAGMWSTPSDLARFAMELRTACVGESRILSEAMAREMLSPQSGGSGLGIFLSGEGEAQRFHHGGDTEGYKCELFCFPESGDGAAIMTNGDRGEGLANEIIRSLAVEYGWPGFAPEERVVAEVDPAVYPAYAGSYRLDIAPDISAVITVEAGRLMLEVVQPIGRNKAELLPEAEGLFFSRESGSRVRFQTDDDGEISGLAILQGDGEYRARRTAS